MRRPWLAQEFLRGNRRAVWGQNLNFARLHALAMLYAESGKTSVDAGGVLFGTTTICPSVAGISAVNAIGVPQLSAQPSE